MKPTAFRLYVAWAMHACLVLVTTHACDWDVRAGLAALVGTWLLALPLVGLGWLLGRWQDNDCADGDG